MPCDTQGLLKNTEHFKLLCSFKYEDTIPFSVYTSQITGITVCIAQADGPFIDGDFNIVTETFDDDGLPYALQHLIFAGSEEYPYKDILQLLANRSLRSTIAASTLQNRTCFTMRAAGNEGFLNLMPIYLDHILYPSLEDSAYLTEVHHITGENDIHVGVVYCKTKNEERNPQYILYKEMLRALYPENCGYHSAIKGTTQNLRESTNNEKVKQFHKKFYRPENLTILITGKIQPDKIFQALLPLEQKIMSKKRTDKFKRPWQTPIEQLEESVTLDVSFPFSDEKYGVVYVAWRGPSALTHVCDYHACLLLLKYLTETSNPLTKELVESGDPSLISWHSSEWSDPYLNIIFKDVPSKKIHLITKESIYKVLSFVYSHGIDMETIKCLIHESIRYSRIDLEKNPHKNIARFLFDHLIYENTDDLKERLNSIRELTKLREKSEKYFLNLLKTYFIDAPMVVVKGKSNLNEYHKLQEEEKHISQVTKLNQICLKQNKELYDAIKNNNILEKILAKVPIPSMYSITFHHIERYNTETFQQHPKLDVKRLPLFTYLDHVNTNFFHLQVIMDTSSINPEYKLYIPLLVEVLTESPMKRKDQLISYEELQDLLVADIIKVKSCIGINNKRPIAHSISLMLQGELQNYEKSLQWCKRFLYDTKLTADSLKEATTRLLNDNDETSGETLAEALIEFLLYTEDNHKFPYNMLRQNMFLRDIQKCLNTDVGQKKVIAKIESVRKVLTSPRNMVAYMAVNVDKLTEQVSDVYEPWNKFFSDFRSAVKTKINITSNSKFLTPFNSCINGYIMGLHWIKSSFLIQSYPCINDFQHSDLPALEVCLTYLRQEGGLIWKEIRESQALSDHFDFYTTVADGLLSLKFTSARNIIAAYQITKRIVETNLAGTKWNQYLYNKAKSSVILNYINNVNSIRLTTDDMSRVTTQYIKPLFDPKQSKTVIVCNNNNVTTLKNIFQQMGFNFNVCKSLDDLNIENVTTK